MNYIWLELVETPQEEWAKKIKPQFRIEGQRHTRRSHDLRSRVLLHPAFRAAQQCLVSMTLQIFQQSGQCARHSIQLGEKILGNNGYLHDSSRVFSFFKIERFIYF